MGAQAYPEHIGMEAVGHSDSLQFLGRGIIVAQANPAFGGLNAQAVGWFKGLHFGFGAGWGFSLLRSRSNLSSTRWFTVPEISPA
jgi:hypothetical protein